MTLLASNLKTFYNNILDIFYPRFCVICNVEYSKINFDFFYLCNSCLLKLPKPTGKSICLKCKSPFGEHLLSKPICQQCRKYKHLFKKVITPLYYEDEVEKLIKDFKFNKKFYMGKILSSLLANSIKDEIKNYKEKIDYITSIPMTYTEKFKRGFNQTEFISKILSKILNIPVINYLKKIKRTKLQQQLSFFDRQNNVKDAFSFKKRLKDLIRDKNILLVDDIYTTGTTVAENCKVLKENGAKQIYVAVLARNVLK